MTSRHAPGAQRRFEFRPSRILAGTLAVAHATVLMALLPLALPLWAKVALAAVIVVSLAYHAWHDAWLASPSAVTALILEEDQVKLATRDGKQVIVTVSDDSLATPLLAVINAKPHGTRTTRRLVILPDSMDAESFRQLRVWLRWH